MPRPTGNRNAARIAAAAKRTRSSSEATIPAPAPLASTKRQGKPNPHVGRESSSDMFSVSDREKERRAEMRASNAGLEKVQVEIEETAAPIQGSSTQSRSWKDSAKDQPQQSTATTLRCIHVTSTGNECELIEVGQRSLEEAAATGTRLPRLTDVSGLDLDDSLDMDDEDEGDAPRSRHNSHDASNTSSGNTGRLQRRHRASSIVSRDDAPVRPSSGGPMTPSIGPTFHLGRFKRRQREPSILGTAQKEPPSRPASGASRYESAHENQDGHGGMGEGSPLGRRAASSADPSPSPPQTRRSGKRKWLEEHRAATKRAAVDAEGTGAGLHHQVPSTMARGASPRSSPPSLVHLPDVPSSSRRFACPDATDSDEALPSIGSSDASSFALPPIESLAHRHDQLSRKASQRTRPRAPAPENDESNMSSPPSLTYSPPRVAPAKLSAKKGRGCAASPKVTTTATLTSLLPRRPVKSRQALRGHSPGEMDGQDDEHERIYTVLSDHDELSFDPRPARRRIKTASVTTRQKQAEEETNKTGASVRRRTYGLGAVSEFEKDNDGAAGDDDAEDTGMVVRRKVPAEVVNKFSEELRERAAFFKEVDKWELDFEDVTGSSSPTHAGQ